MTTAEASKKGWRQIPNPTATYGTLLWGIQKAHKTAVTCGSSKVVARRRRCLEIAQQHAAELEAVRIPDGLCEYLAVAQQPWDVIWQALERAGLACG